ncbi:homoserine O-acetyltransferase [Taibaiella lutea]|uniref:Homoserine O-acetyltransferase n=1 Tax=Taibaiella lutea TaxID=2608001 RepID=A0A5M6CB95_9BACT|nr:homoserine O-acetyltransferase [Taibaiella lutea]KAA5532414.1 homoserine O-acetyltransferase [Taibaiella lutea]
MEHHFHYPHSFSLESGQTLPELRITYHTYGKLNAAKDNIVWICHALTANADVMDWWKGLIHEGAPVNEQKHFIICANIPGSCYGSTGPLSVNPETGKPYYASFPDITIKDMVNAHMLLKAHLGIERICLLIGGSMGGYQAMEWALMEPETIERLFLLATSAAESAWGISIHTAQRLAIEADGSFGEDDDNAGAKGLKAARAVGMLTYRNHLLMNRQQTDNDIEKLDNYKASAYISYQGDKLVNRFNAYSYWKLTKAMDSHNIARGRSTNLELALKQITQPVLLIGISSDILCPVAEQEYMALHIPDCRYEAIDSEYGHDGFLIETAAINGILGDWF